MVEAGQAGAPWWRRLPGMAGGGRARQDAALALYSALVAQARQPALFTVCAVPDSRDGRLETIYLHAMLVFRRLRAEGSEGNALGQALFDLLFADVDRHLREWGVGDLSVGREIKKLVSSFYGRIAALEPLLEGDDPATLAPALRKNVYAELPEVDETRVLRLAAYLLSQVRWLASQPGAALLRGELAFEATARTLGAEPVATVDLGTPGP